MVTNLRYADDIILLATSEAELQELVDRLDRVSCKCSLTQHWQEQGNGEQQHSMPHTHSEWTTGAGGYIPIPWVPDYRKRWVYNVIPYQVKQRAGDWGITVEKVGNSMPISVNIRLMKALVWPVVMCSCESWTLRKNEEHVLMPLRWKDWERFCRFHGQQKNKRVGS